MCVCMCMFGRGDRDISSQGIGIIFRIFTEKSYKIIISMTNMLLWICYTFYYGTNSLLMSQDMTSAKISTTVLCEYNRYRALCGRNSNACVYWQCVCVCAHYWYVVCGCGCVVLENSSPNEHEWLSEWWSVSSEWVH